MKQYFMKKNNSALKNFSFFLKNIYLNLSAPANRINFGFPMPWPNSKALNRFGEAIMNMV